MMYQTIADETTPLPAENPVTYADVSVKIRKRSIGKQEAQYQVSVLETLEQENGVAKSRMIVVTGAPLRDVLDATKKEAVAREFPMEATTFTLIAAELETFKPRECAYARL